MVKVGVDINLKYWCIIVFINVCEYGNLEVVKKLIELGVDVNLCDGVIILLIIVCEVGY